MALEDIQRIIDTADLDATWGDDLRGAMATILEVVLTVQTVGPTVLTQVEYDALSLPVATMVYVIVG